MLFQVVPSVLLSMVALITTYMKESDWLLKNFHQSENGLKSYHGEQNRGYHMKEYKNYIRNYTRVYFISNIFISIEAQNLENLSIF